MDEQNLSDLEDNSPGPGYRTMAPGPTPIPPPAREIMSQPPGYHRTEEFGSIVREVTSKLSRLLGGELSVVPVSASGTGAMEMALWSLVGAGQTVCVIESGKFGERWTNMARRRGCQVVRHRLEWGTTFSPKSVAREIRKHDEVSAVLCTATETSTLVRHPVEELADEFEPGEVLFLCDAISAVGAEPFHPVEHGIHAVIMGAQKGLMGPPGLSFLAVDSRAEARAGKISSNTFYFDLSTALDRLKKDSQTPWTPPLQLLKSQEKSLEILFEEGLESVFERHRNLSMTCRNWLAERNLEIFSERPAVAGTAMKVPSNVDGKQLQKDVHQVHGYYIPGGQRHLEGEIMRIGHLGFVFEEDLLPALNALEAGLRQQGWVSP